MEFRVDEKNGLLNLYPLFADNWMVVRSQGNTPWKLYRRVGDKNDFFYVDEFISFNDVCEAGKNLGPYNYKSVAK